MRTSESIAKIAPALLKAQRKMGAATKDAANPFFKSKYADLGSVMEVVKGPLNEEGISILQPVSSREGSHYVETILLHESGELIASEALRLELDKTDMQKLGSAITYARRYTLQSLLSIPAEDDDAEGTMGRKAPQKAAERPSTRTPELVPAAVVRGSLVTPAMVFNGYTSTPTNAVQHSAISQTVQYSPTPVITTGQTLSADLTAKVTTFGTPAPHPEQPATKPSFRKSAPKLNL